MHANPLKLSLNQAADLTIEQGACSQLCEDEDGRSKVSKSLDLATECQAGGVPGPPALQERWHAAEAIALPPAAAA